MLESHYKGNTPFYLKDSIHFEWVEVPLTMFTKYSWKFFGFGFWLVRCYFFFFFFFGGGGRGQAL